MKAQTSDHYGEFYGSVLFKKLFSGYASGQAESAKQISQRILQRCGIDSGLPAIDRVIDLGCGDGKLLREIQKQHDKHAKKRHLPLHFLGFDVSHKAIERANKARSRCKFVSYNGTADDLLAKMPGEDSLWRSTALLVLGHTWFHLINQDDIVNFINTKRPALILIDIYHNWDETVSLLNKQQFRDEPIRIDPKEGTFCLRSELIPGQPKMMRRGICAVAQNGDARWHVPTTQVAESSEKLFGSRKDYRKLETAQTTGQLTGTCNYVVRKQFRHESGWGPMNCFGLVPLDRDASQINQAWHQVVRAQVKRIFVTPEEEHIFSGIRSLLKLHDEPASWRGPTGFTGSREVLTIEPFDCHATFARIVGIFPGNYDAQIDEFALISELPNSDQRRFPTAYGLFRSIEDRISSPQAFPLKWAHDYDQSDVDREHNQLEELVLGIKKRLKGRNTFNDNDLSRGYFILPLFFGSLPLFALVLKFPNLLPVSSTSASVFHASLTNLHDQIKVVFDYRFVRNQIVCPFVASALEALHTRTCFSNKGHPVNHQHRKDPIEYYLNLIENLLFGIPDSSARTTWKDRKGGVINREWKSWVLTIPSQPIKELQSVEAENGDLWNIWEAEKKRALLDHAMRISYWFEEADFFGKKAHDHWDATIHRHALTRMLNVADLKMFNRANVKINGYLKASCDSHLLRWTVNSLAALAKTSNETPSDAGHQSACDNEYQNLKSVFCKLRENHGCGVRFSWKRLRNIINAGIAGGDNQNAISKLAEVTLPFNEYWKSLDGHFWCREADDPSIAIGDIAEWFAANGFLKNVDLQIGELPPDGTIVFSLNGNQVQAGLASHCGGCDLRQLEEAFNRAGIGIDEFNDKAFNRSTLKIGLKLQHRSGGDSLQITTTFLS